MSQLLQGSTQLAPATRMCGLSSTWRRYDELAHLPEGLVVLADSLCSFNPSYGQGMTIAAMEVVALDKLLVQHTAKRAAAARSKDGYPCSPGWLCGLGKETLKAVHPIVAGAWLLAVGTDMRFSSADSNEPKQGGLIGRAEAAATVYMHTLLGMAPTDSWVSE